MWSHTNEKLLPILLSFDQGCNRQIEIAVKLLVFISKHKTEKRRHRYNCEVCCASAPAFVLQWYPTTSASSNLSCWLWLHGEKGGSVGSSADFMPNVIRQHLFTFQILQLFGFGPSGFLGLRVVIIRLPCVRLVLFPGTFRKHLLRKEWNTSVGKSVSSKKKRLLKLSLTSSVTHQYLNRRLKVIWFLPCGLFRLRVVVIRLPIHWFVFCPHRFLRETYKHCY